MVKQNSLLIKIFFFQCAICISFLVLPNFVWASMTLPNKHIWKQQPENILLGMLLGYMSS